MSDINYQKIISDIVDELTITENLGEVASYIPELKFVDPKKLGMHLLTVDGEHFSAGDSNQKFSIQSISKVLSLTLALKLAGEEVWKRVGVEPSGTPFNSLVQLEYEEGIPRNPFINSGAIVVCDILISHLPNPKQQVLEFVRDTSGNQEIDYCPRVAESEKSVGFRNYSVTNLMKAYDNITNDVEQVLDLYFHMCSIEMTCSELAKTFLFLASDGENPLSKQRIVNSRRAKRINSVMQMCGFYDEAGEFAFRAGLPGKSGVGGGIVAIHPGKFSVAVWSPKLNKKGNSYRGMKALEELTTRTQSSIF